MNRRNFLQLIAGGIAGAVLPKGDPEVLASTEEIELPVEYDRVTEWLAEIKDQGMKEVGGHWEWNHTKMTGWVPDPEHPGLFIDMCDEYHRRRLGL